MQVCDPGQPGQGRRPILATVGQVAQGKYGVPLSAPVKGSRGARRNSDASVLGKTITYVDEPYTVIGVAQRGFSGIEAEAAIDVWVPVTSCGNKEWLTSPHTNWLRVLARLHAFVPPARAQALFDKTFPVHVADKLKPEPDPHWKAVLDAQQMAGGLVLAA